jgi:hypothetical protein
MRHTVCFENEIAAKNISEDELLKLIDYPNFFDMLKLPLPDNRKSHVTGENHSKKR